MRSFRKYFTSWFISQNWSNLKRILDTEFFHGQLDTLYFLEGFFIHFSMHFLSSNLVLTQKRWRFSEIVCFFFYFSMHCVLLQEGKDSYEKKLKENELSKRYSFGHKMEMLLNLERSERKHFFFFSFLRQKVSILYWWKNSQKILEFFCQSTSKSGV